MYRIQYNDITNSQTTITWYSVASAGDAPYDFCATGNPLRFKWYGGRYDTIRGSSITFNVLIRNQTDRTNIYNLMNVPHYVVVKKFAATVWIGRVFPQLFTEVIEPFPYTIQVKATDQLGRLDKYRPLLTDFPEPFNAGTPNVTVLDVVNKFLTDASFAPGATQPTAPTRLNISMSIYWNSVKLKAFETTYLDTAAFIDDDDRYQSKHEILDKILKPFQCKLYQWHGEWWLMSWDAEWNQGNFEYEKYDLDYTAGWTSVGKAGTLYGLFQLFDDCKQVKGSASMDFLPSWQGIDYSMNYKKTNNIMPLFANNSGNFYNGYTATPLEFNPVPVTNRLRHWTYSGAMTIGPNVTNDGWVAVKSYISTRPEYVQKIVRLDGQADVDGIGFSTDLSWIQTYPQTTGTFHRAKMVIRLIATSGAIWRLWFDSGTPTWESTDTKTFEFSDSVDVKMNLPDNVASIRSIEVRIYPAFSNTTAIKTALLRNFKLYVINELWDDIRYKEENLFNYYAVDTQTSEPPVSLDFEWGMCHPVYNNNHFFTLTSPYDRTGVAMANAWMKEPVTDQIGTTQPLKQWMIARLHDDNVSVTRKIKGSFVINSLTSDIIPHRVVQDKDGKYYQFVSGEYDDKNKTWTGVEFIEFKGYKT